jgi:Ca2+/Na+ antiporter
MGGQGPQEAAAAAAAAAVGWVMGCCCCWLAVAIAMAASVACRKTHDRSSSMVKELVLVKRC